MMPEHGTYYRYRHFDCRCLACKKANAEVQRKYKQKLLDTPIPKDRHGQLSTYTNWSCRCSKCKAANAAYSRRMRAT